MGVKLYFLTISDAIDQVKHLEEDVRVILLIENTKSALENINKGLNIDKINLGNQARRPEKKEINQSIYLKKVRENEQYFKKIFLL